MDALLLTTAYFPPVQYLSHIRKADKVVIEQFEHFGKQSYRNRCEIMSANGIMSLTVPVEKASNGKILTKDVRIDYASNWQKLHLKTIESAYKNSPFYDYYIDDLLPLFEKKETYLLDLNNKILSSSISLMNLKKVICFTDDYIKESIDYLDLRNTIHPKISKRTEDSMFVVKPYHQTFQERFPFAPNLSILDLLFNTGPEATDYL